MSDKREIEKEIEKEIEELTKEDDEKLKRFWRITIALLLVWFVPYTVARVFHVWDAKVDAVMPWPLAKAASATGWGEIALWAAGGFLVCFVAFTFNRLVEWWDGESWKGTPSRLKKEVIVRFVLFCVLAALPPALVGGACVGGQFAALKFASTLGGRYELDKVREERREKPRLPPPLGGAASRVENENVVSLAE